MSGKEVVLMRYQYRVELANGDSEVIEAVSDKDAMKLAFDVADLCETKPETVTKISSRKETTRKKKGGRR